MEKLSEKHLRQEKVNRLKEKIRKEINDEMISIRKDLYVMHKEMLDGNFDIEKYNFSVTDYYYLLQLQEYISEQYAFMCVEMSDNQGDIIVYSVPDIELNIWLQDDYNFVSNFLFNARDIQDVLSIMNDKYFGINFTNIFDRIFYNKKNGGMTYGKR